MRTDLAGTSREVWFCSLQRSPVAPYRPKDACLRTIPLRRWSAWATRALSDSPLRFFAPCVSVLAWSGILETPPARVIRVRFFGGTRPGPAFGLFSRPGRKVFAFRRRSWDLPTLRSLFPSAGDGVLGRSTPRTHLPFRQPLRREFHRSRDSPNAGDVVGRVGRGSWGLAPRATRSLRPAGPAIAFVHRADRVHRSQLPWVFRSSLGS